MAESDDDSDGGEGVLQGTSSRGRAASRTRIVSLESSLGSGLGSDASSDGNGKDSDDDGGIAALAALQARAQIVASKSPQQARVAAILSPMRRTGLAALGSSPLALVSVLRPTDSTASRTSLNGGIANSISEME